MSKLKCTTKAASCLFAVFLYSFTATAYAQEVKLPRGGDSMYNIDLPGSDIDHKVLKAPPAGMLDLRETECSKACWQNKDCIAWTYVKPNTIQGPHGNCWLKNSIPEKKKNSCCVSGAIGEAGTDRPGGDYSRFDNLNGLDVTPQLCKEICLKQDKCKAWTFVKPNTIQGPKGVCWLKDSVPSPVKNNCCISGYFEIEHIK